MNQRLIDDGDKRPVGCIAFAKVASSYQGRTQRCKCAGGHDIERQLGSSEPIRLGRQMIDKITPGRLYMSGRSHGSAD